MPLTHTPPGSQLSVEDATSLCGICSQIMNNTQSCYCTPCEHVFHKLCLENWLENHAKCFSCSHVLDRSLLKIVVGNCSPKSKQPAARRIPPATRAVTRHLAKTLEQNQSATEPSDPPLNISDVPASGLDASNSTNPAEQARRQSTFPRRGRGRGRPMRSYNAPQSANIDYSTIQAMIER